MTTTIRTNTSELSNGQLGILVNKQLPGLAKGLWQLAVGTHTDHTDETFPCIYDIAESLDDHNVVLLVHEDDEKQEFGVTIPKDMDPWDEFYM